MPQFMSDFTRILSQIEQGDPQAAENLLPLVYDELRKLAAAQERATAASTAAAAAGIPVLVGTPKQVAWAATIRQEYLDEVLCGVADNVIEREARASWWIDNRYAISDAVNRVRRAAIAQAAKGSN